MARLIIQDGASQRSFDLPQGTVTVGRDQENAVPIQEKSSSRRQFQIEYTPSGYKLVDLESRNGTRVNENFVNQALLRPGDRIRVGKAVLTFEDADYKGPPAGPPPVLAAEAGRPALAISRPSPPEETSHDAEAHAARRSTRSLRPPRPRPESDRAKDQKTVTLVVVGAAIFGLILVGLIVASSLSGESSSTAMARKDLQQAQHIFRQKPFEALKLLERIPRSSGDVHARAQQLTAQINSMMDRTAAAGITGEEQKEFNALYDFCEGSRQNPRASEEMTRRCEEFKRKFPGSSFVKNADEYLRIAADHRAASRGTELTNIEREVADELKSNLFGNALRKVNALSTKYKEAIDVRERLLKVHDDIVDKARAHYQAEHARAEDLKARGQAPEARRLYEDLIRKMGDNGVDELKDYCKIAHAAREALN